MKKDSRYIWYMIDIVVFLGINLFLLFHFDIPLTVLLRATPWTVIVILALGIYRLTDTITHEDVAKPLRELFYEKHIVEDGREHWRTSTKGFKGFMGGLLSCNACLGVWVSMIVFYLYLLYPAPTLIFMIIMTLTCFERFLSKIYNVLEKRG